MLLQPGSIGIIGNDLQDLIQLVSYMKGSSAPLSWLHLIMKHLGKFLKIFRFAKYLQIYYHILSYQNKVFFKNDYYLFT